MNRAIFWKRLLDHRQPANRRQSYRPLFEELESRRLPSATGFRPIDEVGNNIGNPNLGTAGTDLIRTSPVAYKDGISKPSLGGGAPTFVPSPRLVSNVVSDQADPNNPGQDMATVNQDGLSDFIYTWGQFIDHDMGLTPDDGANDFPIPPDPTNPNDPIGSLAFGRSLFDPNTGTSTSNPRQQINADTAFLDLSQVYGSTAAVSNALRTFSGGMLKTNEAAPQTDKL